MTTLKFVFHIDEPEPNKERELRDAELRAHAARAAHQSRKAGKKYAFPPSQSSSGGQITKFALSRYSRRKKTSKDKSCGTIVPAQNSLIKPYSQSKIDAFLSTPWSATPVYLLDAVDYAWSNVWSSLRPPQPTGRVDPHLLGWRKASTSHPALYHATLSAAANLMLANMPHHSNVEQLKTAQVCHNIMASRHIRDELASNHTASDELLLTIFCLATHGGVRENSVQTAEGPHTPSPVSGSARLSSVIKLKHTHEHENALWLLVRQRGGLVTVKLPGLRETLSIYNIFQATRSGSKPDVPQLLNTTSPFECFETLTDDELQLGTAFQNDQLFEIDEQLYNILQRCCHVTAALDKFQRQRGLAELDPWYMIDTRHVLHYRVLSLKKRSLDKKSTSKDILYEMCRVATQIYSDLNIWPTHIVSGVRHRLTEELDDVLDFPKFYLGWKDYPALMCWSISLGAIGFANPSHSDNEAIGKSFRNRCVQQLVEHGQHLRAWQDFHRVLTCHLWWDYTMGQETQKLWKEICIERLLNTAPSID